MRYFITSEQLERIGKVHLLLVREIKFNQANGELYSVIGKIKASVNLLDDNTGTKLKETILNDLSLLQAMI